MQENTEVFMATLLAAIGLFSLLLGALIMKFASGKTKTTGILATGMGAVFLVLWLVLTFVTETYAVEIIFWDAIVAVIAAVLGAGVAFVVFLLSIMYS